MRVFFPLEVAYVSVSVHHTFLTYTFESMESDEKWSNKHINDIVTMLSKFVEIILDHLETEKVQPHLVLIHSSLLQNGANTNIYV